MKTRRGLQLPLMLSGLTGDLDFLEEAPPNLVCVCVCRSGCPLILVPFSVLRAQAGPHGDRQATRLCFREAAPIKFGRFLIFRLLSPDS